jgi:hypothetical protein
LDAFLLEPRLGYCPLLRAPLHQVTISLLAPSRYESLAHAPYRPVSVFFPRMRLACFENISEHGGWTLIAIVASVFPLIALLHYLSIGKALAAATA